jgi:hypothetical protein
LSVRSISKNDWPHALPFMYFLVDGLCVISTRACSGGRLYISLDAEEHRACGERRSLCRATRTRLSKVKPVLHLPTAQGGKKYLLVAKTQVVAVFRGRRQLRLSACGQRIRTLSSSPERVLSAKTSNCKAYVIEDWYRVHSADLPARDEKYRYPLRGRLQPRRATIQQ